MTNTSVTELTFWNFWQLFYSPIVDLDNLVFEGWQAAYCICSASSLFQKQNMDTVFLASLRPLNMGRKEKSQTQMCCLLRNVFYWINRCQPISKIPVQSANIKHLGITIFSRLSDLTLLLTTIEEELMPCRNIPFSLRGKIATETVLPTITNTYSQCYPQSPGLFRLNH